ncbi:MAG: helix-hairpin-helix domain-containing protein [Candidatus Odinarchaeota archaeon]
MTEQKLLPKNAESQISHKEKKKPHITGGSKDTHVGLTPTIKKEDLLIVKGIGAHMAELLFRNDISKIKDLAHAKPQQLALIPGIGLLRAQTLIKNAKEHLHHKNLNGFSTNPPLKKELEIPILDASVGEYGTLKPCVGSEVYSNNNEQEVGVSYEKDDMDEQEDIIVEVDGYGNESNIQESEQFILKSETILEIESEPSKPVRVPETPFKGEMLSSEECKQLEDNVRAIFQEHGFIIIEKSPKPYELLSKIDVLAIKLISDWGYQEKEIYHSDLILIVPVKISPLEGSLIVSENNIEYHAVNKTSDFYTKSLPISYLKELIITGQNIRFNLANKGILFTVFNNFCTNSLSLVRSYKKKNLYYRYDKNQCEILINPIILSKKKVGFTEKVIPFAYHTNSNVHILQVSRLSEILEYLEKKYILLESHIKKKSMKEVHYAAENKLRHQLKYTWPFISLTFIYITIFIFHAYSILGLLNQFALWTTVLMGIVYGYIFRNYYKQKSIINREFNTPYLKRELNLDNSTLKIINQGLPSSLMEQFSYECLGKNPKFKVIHKVEQQNSQEFLHARELKKKMEDTTFFEEDKEQQEKYNEHLPDIPEISDDIQKLRKKYSSFLED